MVYIFGASLPNLIQDKFNIPSDDKLNPQNYIKYRDIFKVVQIYNNEHVNSDHLFLHEFCKEFITHSDFLAIQKNWEDESRPQIVKEEHKLRLQRIENRKYQQMTKDVTRTNQKSLLLGTDSVKDYEKSVNFALSFIFSIFASALVGYYLGIYFFQVSHEKSLVLAVIFLMGALILETTLYILKIVKDQQIEKVRKNTQQQSIPQKKKTYPQSNKQKQD